MALQALSQRDPRWSGTQLGTSSATIGTHGCTITSLAVILGTTPDVVNQKLLAVNGYAQGNLVIWSKIAEAFPGTFVKRGWEYNNDEVVANIPCLVEVDGTSIGGVRHWVVFIGNQQMIDPWTGTIRPTNIYPVKGFAIIKPPLQGVQADPIVQQLNYQIEATNQCQSQLATALSQASEYQKQLDSYIFQANEYKIKAEDYQKKYETEQSAVISLKDELAKVHQEDSNFASQALEAQHELTEVKKGIRKVADDLGVQYDPADDKLLVEEVLNEINNLQQKSSPEFTQLEVILKQFVSLGINNYLQSKNIEPIDPSNPPDNLEEKTSIYLTDLANELLSQTSINPNESPVVTSIKAPKPNPLTNLIQTFIGIFFVSK